MGFLPQETILGKLEPIEVYEFYDKPILFSCRNASGSIFLAVSIAEGDESETWLYTQLSLNRFQSVRSGGIDLHDAFTQAEDGFVFKVVTPFSKEEGVTVERMPAQETTKDMLPLPGEFLNLETETLPELDNPTQKAKTTRQEIINLTLNFPGVFRTEAPVQALSEILVRLQNTINIIGMVRAHSDAVTERIRDKMQMSILFIGGGSFVVQLASTEMVNLLGESNVGDATEELIKLFETRSNQEQLKAELRRLRPKVGKSYRLLLESLSKAVEDMKLVWGSPKEGRGGSVYISKEQMLDAITILEQLEEQDSPTIQITGTLTGVFLRSERFEIETEDRAYTGKILEKALETASNATISERYAATIREVNVINPVTEESSTEYHLVNLSPAGS